MHHARMRRQNLALAGGEDGRVARRVTDRLRV
jgi:hypothetical protein